MDRRNFVAATAGAGSRILGVNNRIRAALIGSGGRGRYVAGEFRETGADVLAVADIYEPNLQAGLKAAASGAKGYEDYRRLLDDKSIDAVLVATPDHWHAPMVIDAVRAGKDVYVEKPLAHQIQEIFDVINAVRGTKRIVKVGTQRRSFDIFQEAKTIVDSGQLGDVRLVTSWWMDHTATLSNRQFQGKIDWKQFLGSAQKHEPSAQRVFNWYYFWDYSGGLLVGRAAHIVDAIHWLRKVKHPRRADHRHRHHLRRVSGELLSQLHPRLQGYAVSRVKRADEAVPRIESALRRGPRRLRVLSGIERGGDEGQRAKEGAGEFQPRHADARPQLFRLHPVA